MVDACHGHGMLYFYGTDGNIWPVADEMFLNIGIDGYFEIDKGAGMGLRELRERYPNVTLIGGIRPAVLHQGSVDEVVREVMEALEVAHELSGIVVGVSNMIMPGTPPENIMALLNTIKDNR